jgi:hypothetical protein
MTEPERRAIREAINARRRKALRLGSPTQSRTDSDVDHVVTVLRERRGEWIAAADLDHELHPRRIGLALREAHKRRLVLRRPRNRYVTEWRAA